MSSSSSSFSPKDVTIEINSQDSSSSSVRNNASRTTGKNDDTAATRIKWRGSSYDLSSEAGWKVTADSKNFDFMTEGPLSRRPENEKMARDEVPVRSGNNSYRRNSSSIRSKTKSRLLDPLEESKAKRQTRRMSDVDEDNPFLEEDIPEEYKRMKFSVLSVMQLVSLILICALLVCSLTIEHLKRRKAFELELWRWEVMVLVLISGRLLSGWGVRIVVILMEKNFLWRKRVLYFVYGLRNAVQNCVWLALVLVAWECIFNKKVERLTHKKILPFITKIWVCLLVGTIIWLLKTLLIKVMASSFHVSTFFDRIQESLFNQYVIESLSRPPWVEIELEQGEEEKIMIEVQRLKNAEATITADLKANVFPKSGRWIGSRRTNASSADTKDPKLSKFMSKKEQQKGITIDELHRLNQKNVSAWNMKRLMSIVKKGALSTLNEEVRGSIGHDQQSVEEITNENEAKAVFKKIFINVSVPGTRYIYEEDLTRFMQPDEVSKTMGLFKGVTERKGISKQTLKNWVVNAFRERRALALSLNDTNTAVKKLHKMINGLVALILIVIWLLILKIATTQFFIFLSSQLLLAAFMFGNTLKTTFEGIIFMFVMHPFDVGDRVDVDDVQMVVEEMDILTTVFLKFDNCKIYYPNSVLATKPIYNYYRSPDMQETIDFSIHISTPPEKISVMKERLRSYFNNKGEHWHSEVKIIMTDVEDMNRLKWSIWCFPTMNFHDMGERFERRSHLIEEMVKIFREHSIEYRLLTLDVNVCNVLPLNSGRLPSN